MTQIFPSIAGLEDGLFSVDAPMRAIEAHGVLCGMLCAQGATEVTSWLVHVLGETTAGSEALQGVAGMLTQMYQATLEQMNDSVAGFSLYLPDDDEPLEERIESLGLWCQGYLYGLAAGGVREDTGLPDDTQELMRDILEISRVGQASLSEDDGESAMEQDEVAYAEVMEYVRMGVLLIYEELQPLQSSQTVH